MDWVCVLLVAVSVRYGAVCARALFVICCVLSVCCVYGCAVTCMCVCVWTVVSADAGRCSVRLALGASLER